MDVILALSWEVWKLNACRNTRYTVYEAETPTFVQLFSKWLRFFQDTTLCGRQMYTTDLDELRVLSVVEKV